MSEHSENGSMKALKRFMRIIQKNPYIKFCSTVLFVLVSSFPAVAQSQQDHPTFGDSINELVSFFAPFVFPKVIQDGYQLKDYIRSEEFAALRSQRGDLNAVDAIFAHAMHLSWNNAYEALLLSTVATMDHSRFGVNLPLLGPLLWVPLTSECEEDFQKRIATLPRLLYDDSPHQANGDRDKLQHFFGSAFLTYICESRDAAERFGDFVEWGEDKVIVDGALDERDYRANTHGQEFGLALLRDKTVRPSSYIMYTLAYELAIPTTSDTEQK
jgi:hypothetical protein